MNEKFFALDQEKQKAIINAGFHVFSHYDYHHASTEMIARRAGISKALLFHYFGNKRQYFLFLFDHALAVMMDRLSELHDYEETDFFDILTDAQMKKMDIMREYPDLSQFLIYGYLESADEIEPQVAETFNSTVKSSTARLLERMDRSKFKDSITAEQAMNLVIWISEGYMKNVTSEQLEDVEAVNRTFLDYMELLRRHFYREEYL